MSKPAPSVFVLNDWLYVVAESEQAALDYYMKEHGDERRDDPPDVADGSAHGYYSRQCDAEEEVEPDSTMDEAMIEKLGEGLRPPFELASACDFY